MLFLDNGLTFCCWKDPFYFQSSPRHSNSSNRIAADGSTSTRNSFRVDTESSAAFRAPEFSNNPKDLHLITPVAEQLLNHAGNKSRGNYAVATLVIDLPGGKQALGSALVKYTQQAQKNKKKYSFKSI